MNPEMKNYPEGKVELNIDNDHKKKPNPYELINPKLPVSPTEAENEKKTKEDTKKIEFFFTRKNPPGLHITLELDPKEGEDGFDLTINKIEPGSFTEDTMQQLVNLVGEMEKQKTTVLNSLYGQLAEYVNNTLSNLNKSDIQQLAKIIGWMLATYGKQLNFGEYTILSNSSDISKSLQKLVQDKRPISGFSVGDQGQRGTALGHIRKYIYTEYRDQPIVLDNRKTLVNKLSGGYDPNDQYNRSTASIERRRRR